MFGGGKNLGFISGVLILRYLLEIQEQTVDVGLEFQGRLELETIGRYQLIYCM